jgi:hypothetical protein
MELIPSAPIELDIPEISRPQIDGIGEMVPELYTFNKVGIYPMGIYDESLLKETTCHLFVAYIKREGLIMATIPFWYRYGSFREHSKSLFKFKNDAALTKFKAYVADLITKF